VYDEFKVNIRDAVLGLIRRERDGEPQDRLLLKNAVQVCVGSLSNNIPNVYFQFLSAPGLH
jgi:hypothetical protein